MFLDLDAQTAAARGGYGEERYEKLEFQAKVRDAFTKVSADVKSHGGRWVTIDASKTLDQVTDDIQKAVHRVTSSIDRVGAKLGKLFVSERPPNGRAVSSSELLPPGLVTNSKRLSQSSLESGRAGQALESPSIQINSATTNGAFPASRPSGSPLSYTEQLAAVRTAAAGTLSGFFGGSNAALDQQIEKPLPEVDGPSPVNATRGQGFDSARVLAKYPENSGRRRTLIDVIGEIENQPPTTAFSEHRRSMSAAAEPTSPTDAYPSTFAQAGRVRRSTDQGRSVSQLPTIVSDGAQPNVAPRAASLTVQSGNAAATSPEASTGAERPPLSPASHRTSSYTSVGQLAGGADNSLAPSPGARASTLSPAFRTASPAITSSSRSSLASPPLPAASASPPIQRPASASPGDHNLPPTHPYFNSDLSAQHLSMLNVQQGQAEMQEQYMRNYMAMMANPMMAQQAHYQMMLQRHQQQYYGRAASAIGAGFGGVGANGNGVVQNTAQQGGAPLAAFMQPSAATTSPAPAAAASESANAKSTNAQRERMRSTHKRSQSSVSLMDNNAVSASAGQHQGASQPMLSMMMAPPPPGTSMATSHSAAASPTTATFPQQQQLQQMYYQQHTTALPIHPQQQQQMYAAAQQQQQQQQQMFYQQNRGQVFPQMMPAGGGWGGGGGQRTAVDRCTIQHDQRLLRRAMGVS